MNLGKYSKAIAAGAAALAYVVADQVLDANDVIQIALAVLGALGVYMAPKNKETTE